MRNRPPWIAVGVVAWIAALATYSFAQPARTTTAEEGKRKVKAKVVPQYPDLARRTNITGKVRMEVTIAADGRIKSMRALGGHPILVQACEAALKSWKFVPGSEETTQIVDFDFTGANN